jgi:N4-gp56 family major capsid protein
MTMNYNDQTNLAYLIPKIWSAKLYNQMLGKFYFGRFTGPEGSGMPVISKGELLNQAGDSIYIQQVGNLTGNGLAGPGMEGNEEQFSLKRVTLTPTWLRKAVAIDAPADKQINTSFRNMATEGLSRWWAETLDTSKWTAATTLTACGFEEAIIETIYGGTATSVNEISSSDDFTVDLIREGAALLRDDNVPGIAVPDLPGVDYYVCFINTYQALSLRQDADWQALQKDANIRGSKNPLFTGSLGEIEQVVVYETTQCVRTLNSPAVSGVDPTYVSRSVMMGSEALAHGINTNMVWKEQWIDYDWQFGTEARMAWEDKVLSSDAIKHIVTSAVKPGEVIP